ncbi:hypothetical protein FOQG_18865 [Fusarium oxysporum f. sp. raphani 54005]|uniref:Uncharacterized protein n=2 Tax=Fusarium oxysporum TaxID=5507 RepID=X0B2P8_FUSOX|nr:hypothetical protein FOQG_18865 [Fusarium oxysporum f. sp. raphani 54005]EXL64761.1 hypothetical protein FOPG_18986 [Fusarium oxysporum f. sp. conglutinans race 2 54008]
MLIQKPRNPQNHTLRLQGHIRPPIQLIVSQQPRLPRMSLLELLSQQPQNQGR